MITELTKEQEEYLPIFRQEMFNIGVNCNEVDKKTTKKIITKFYQKINKKKPIFIFCESPITCNMIINIINIINNRASLGASLGASLWASLGDSLGDSLWDSLGDSLWASLWASLWDSLRDSLWDSLGASLRDSLWDSLRDSLKIYSTEMWGQQDIYWIGLYKFGEYIGVKYEKEKNKILNEWYKLAESCMWWYPFENYCIVCNKPKQINWNGTNEYIHSYEKPAVEFRDGWCVYCIDGIRVKEKLIKEPMTITIQEIEQEENAELKRIKIQVYDYHRKPGAYIKDSGAKMINKDEVGELYKKEIGGEQEPLVMVKLKNSTVNTDGSVDEYYLRVPPHIKTARQAVAWTFGMEAKEYHPIIET